MSRWDKLLKKIRSLSKDVRFEEVRRILEHYGYEAKQPRGGSSHFIFRKPGFENIVIAAHEPIKTAYLIQVKAVIERELKNEQN